MKGEGVECPFIYVQSVNRKQDRRIRGLLCLMKFVNVREKGLLFFIYIRKSPSFRLCYVDIVEDYHLSCP